MKPGFFIDRPVFSTVLSILIVIGRNHRTGMLPDGAVSADYAP